MANYPSNLRYTKEHEWIRLEGNRATVGITHFAQDQLGDVVFVELPSVGDELTEGATFGTVESVKTVSDLYSPMRGKVVEVNEGLNDSPELVNKDPYGEAWMLVIEINDRTAYDALLDAAAYEAFINEK